MNATNILKLAKPFLMACLFTVAASSEAALISFNPQETNTFVGEMVNVDLVISDLAATDSVGGFDLDLLFDSTVVSLSSVTFGSGLDIWDWGDSFRDATSMGDGWLNITELAFDTFGDLDDFQADEFVLATLSFSAIAEGTSFLEASANYVSDSLGGIISDIGTESGLINVASVPEPGSISLLLLGLSGLLVAQRKRSHSEGHVDL